MTSIRTGPCNWPLAHCGEPTTGEVVCSSLNGLSADMKDLVQQMAVEYLWNWTGRQFGTCPITIRPCRDDCGNAWNTTYSGYAGNRVGSLPWFAGPGGNGSPINPALIGGKWWNLPCGGCNNDVCSCSYVPTIELVGPVASVDEVIVDGVVLPSSSYRVDNYRFLVRTDGLDWPACQDMVRPLTELDTLGVTYQIGVDVPAGGRVAAGVLACQLAKATCGDGSCQLPVRLQNVTRQGVQMTVLDAYANLYNEGTTGLYVVDSWVASIRAAARTRSGSRIASPDTYERRRTTTP